nr:immunoglobulin light chain junction region [Macaca mulatta]
DYYCAMWHSNAVLF